MGKNVFFLFVFFSLFLIETAQAKPVIVSSYDGTPSLYDMTYDFRCPTFRLRIQFSRIARDPNSGKSTFRSQILLNGKKTNVPENFEKFLNEHMLMALQPKCSNDPVKRDIWIRVYGYFPFRGPERYYEGVLATSNKPNDVRFTGSEQPREEFSPLIP